MAKDIQVTSGGWDSNPGLRSPCRGLGSGPGSIGSRLCDVDSYLPARGLSNMQGFEVMILHELTKLDTACPDPHLTCELINPAGPSLAHLRNGVTDSPSKGCEG